MSLTVLTPSAHVHPPPGGLLKLFVYGTLKRGGRLHDFLKGFRFVGPRTLPKSQLWDLGPYPAVVFDMSLKTKVHGELFNVDEEALEILDEVEESAGFKRMLHLLQEGEWAWVYGWNSRTPPLGSHIIDSGIWWEKWS